MNFWVSNRVWSGNTGGGGRRGGGREVSGSGGRNDAGYDRGEDRDWDVWGEGRGDRRMK